MDISVTDYLRLVWIEFHHSRMWGLFVAATVHQFSRLQKSRHRVGSILDYIRLSPAEYPLFATPFQGAVTLTCALVYLVSPLRVRVSFPNHDTSLLVTGTFIKCHSSLLSYDIRPEQMFYGSASVLVFG